MYLPTSGAICLDVPLVSLYNSSTFFFFSILGFSPLKKIFLGGNWHDPPYFRHGKSNGAIFVKIKQSPSEFVQKQNHTYKKLKNLEKFVNFYFFKQPPKKLQGYDWILLYTPKIDHGKSIGIEFTDFGWCYQKIFPKQKNKISKSLFFGWGAKYLSMAVLHSHELSANQRIMVEIE